MSDNYHMALVLTSAGGFLESYIYVCRDHVLASAQTGNIINLDLCFIAGNYRDI